MLEQKSATWHYSAMSSLPFLLLWLPGLQKDYKLCRESLPRLFNREVCHWETKLNTATCWKEMAHRGRCSFGGAGRDGIGRNKSPGVC